MLQKKRVYEECRSEFHKIIFTLYLYTVPCSRSDFDSFENAHIDVPVKNLLCKWAFKGISSCFAQFFQHFASDSSKFVQFKFDSIRKFAHMFLSYLNFRTLKGNTDCVDEFFFAYIFLSRKVSGNAYVL